MKKILLLGSQHGDELLGIRLYEYFKEACPELAKNVTYVCGNPRAFAQNTRSVESDMNRSYAAKHPESYEEKRAESILGYIKKEKFDYVLDVHTSTTDIGLCIITPDLSAKRKIIIGASPIKNILAIPLHIAKFSLVGQVPQAISIECNELLATHTKTLDSLVQQLTALLEGSESLKVKRHIYQITDFIDKSSHDLPLINFRPVGDRVPVMVGGKVGRTYKGFWADLPESTTI